MVSIATLHIAQDLKSTIMSSQKKLDPLRDFLDAVVTRIEALEAHCGITMTKSSSAHSSGNTMQKTPSVKHLTGTGELKNKID